MKTNTRIGVSLVAVGIVAGIGWMGWNFSFRSSPSPSAQSPKPKVQSLFDSVLESPEVLDGLAVDGVPVESVAVAPRPELLSEVERTVSVPTKEREPVAAQSLYFWSDYASLRKDAIRNPDSAENRAGVVSLMKARQGRLGQK